jgi:prepilin-type N-terminal cleavage/methylation domain-containing protein
VARYKNNITGFTLIEILIGVVISAIMMAAMFTTYTVVSNSYSQVSDVAGISRSGRDIVTLMMRDIRLAGFKYHYGTFSNANTDYPKRDYLEFVAGDTEETREDSHAPIIIYKNTLNYADIEPDLDEGGSYVQGLDGKHNPDDFCCDRIHIVYGDFVERDTAQPYKRYKITYYAVPMQRVSSKEYGVNEEDPTKYYGLYRSKSSWIQPLGDDTGGEWVHDSESGECLDCYRAELVREYLEDMEFIALDENGVMVEALPSNMEKIMSIRTIDLRLTFRSSSQKGYFKNKINRMVKSFTDERTKQIDTRFHRDTIFLTVHTRNIGGGDI